MGLIGWGGSAWAAADPLVLPKPPFVAAAPDLSKWLVKYTYQEGGKPGANTNAAPEAIFMALPSDPGALDRPERIETTKAMGTYLKVVVDIKGRKEEMWSDGKLQTIKLPGENRVMINTASGPGLYKFDFSHGDFSDMEWLSSDTFAGYQNYRGKPCLVFKKDETTVYIDSSTRLPVHWETDTEKRDFTFEEPPTGPIPAPDYVQQPLNKLRDTVRQISSTGNRP